MQAPSKRYSQVTPPSKMGLGGKKRSASLRDLAARSQFLSPPPLVSSPCHFRTFLLEELPKPPSWPPIPSHPMVCRMAVSAWSRRPHRASDLASEALATIAKQAWPFVTTPIFLPPPPRADPHPINDGIGSHPPPPINPPPIFDGVGGMMGWAGGRWQEGFGRATKVLAK